MENITLEKINFVNGSAGKTPLNSNNMNAIQQNTENAINKVVPIITGIEENTENNNSDIAEAKINIENNTNNILEINNFIKNSMKTMEAEGTSIHVSDSADYPCKLRVEGKSEQDGEPSTQNKVEMQNTSGDLEVKATARNILPRTFAEDLLKRLNVSSLDAYLVEIDGKNYFKYPANLGYQTGKNYFTKDIFEESTQYVFKLAIMKNDSETSGKINIGIKYTDGTFESLGTSVWTNMTEKEVTIISDENKTIEEIGISYNSGITYINLDKYILCKLEAGMDTNKIEYEPYKEQIVTFPLGEQKLMKDGYLGESGIVNKRKQIVLTGTETYISEVLGSVYLYEIEKNDMLFSNAGKGLCSHFINYTNNYSTRIGNIRFGWNNKNIYFYTSFPTLEEFKTWLVEQYSAGTPVIVEYELETEETTPYTEEQAAAKKQIDALKTYRTVTNINNSQDTNMKLTYKKDLQTQFQEIEALVLESGV